MAFLHGNYLLFILVGLIELRSIDSNYFVDVGSVLSGLTAIGLTITCYLFPFVAVWYLWADRATIEADVED